MRPPNLLAFEATVRWQVRARRFFTWTLRPKFLKYRGKPMRLKWWLLAWLVFRIERKIQPRLTMARKIMYRHHEGGRSDPQWMAGKRLAEKCRKHEYLVQYIALEAGPQHPDGTSTVDLMDTAGRVR